MLFRLKLYFYALNMKSMENEDIPLLIEEEVTPWIGYIIETENGKYEIVKLIEHDPYRLKFNIRNLETNVIDQIFVVARTDFADAAKEKYLEGDYFKALEFSEIALRQNPKNLNALNVKAIALRNLNKLEEAVTLLEDSKAEFPNSYFLYSNLGLFYYDLDKYDLAEINLLKALELEENEISILLNLGRLYGATNQFEKAIIYFNKVISLNPAKTVLDQVNIFISKTNELIESRDKKL